LCFDWLSAFLVQKLGLKQQNNELISELNINLLLFLDHYFKPEMLESQRLRRLGIWLGFPNFPTALQA